MQSLRLFGEDEMDPIQVIGLNPADLRIDVSQKYKSINDFYGFQSYRITHIPTGEVVEFDEFMPEDKQEALEFLAQKVANTNPA